MNNTATESKHDKASRTVREFHQTMEKIAVALNAAHYSSRYERCGEITFKDGLVIRAVVDAYSAKVEFSLDSLKNKKGENFTARDCMDYEERKGATPVCLSINCGITRAAETIAADITRRLLPDARKFWARLTERVNQSNEYIDGCASQAEVFAKLLETVPSQSYANNRAEKTFHCYNVEGTHSVTVAKDSVNFNFSGSPELALKVLELMKAAYVPEVAAE